MPTTKLQDVVFTALMGTFMAYGMICYNISLGLGGLSNFVFVAALHELVLIAPIVFALEFFVVGPIAHGMAARLVNFESSSKLAVIVSMSCSTVLLMCPVMSFVATVLFDNPGSAEIVSVWLQHTALNFPMALIWQLFFAGPIIRAVFSRGLVVVSKGAPVAAAVPEVE